MNDATFRMAQKAGAVKAQLRSSLRSIRTASGKTVPILGVFLVSVRVRGRPYTGPFTVVQNLSSDIIVGIVMARDMQLDYSVTDNKFTFRGEPDSPTFAVNAAKAITVSPKKSVRLVCSVTQNGAPVRNHTVLATVQQTDVLATTDGDGRFTVVLSNPNNSELVFHRNQRLGLAEYAGELDAEVPVSKDNVQHVAALLDGEARRPEAAQPGGQAAQQPSPKDQQLLQQQFDEATKHLPDDVKGRVLTILQRNWRAISRTKFDLGLSRVWQHTIPLSDPTPVYHKQFPVPMEHVGVIREHIDRWLALGIVEPAHSPYNSPLFCVKKKGSGFRLCLDYRALNSKSHPTNYSIRTPEDCMSEIGRNGGKHFIALDLTSGFYQMPLHKASRPYTAFTMPPYGQLQWTRGAMGLKGCPGSFARLMDITLQGIPNVLIYIDDVLIYGQTQSDALATLDRVLQRLANHNLKVNIAKSSFFAERTEYLGHTLTSAGIFPGKDKTAAIVDAQPPASVKQLKSFLGLVNYFRGFIKHFAHQAGKLYKLTRSDSTWKSGPLPPDALRTFLQIKRTIANVVPRRFPFPEGKYHLFTDGSLGDAKEEGGLGGHLMQEGPDGVMHTIAFASRALKKHEKNYSAFLLELQAAVYAIEYFDHYLKGRTFTLYTDHAPMSALSAVHTKTLHRLHSLLNEYSFEIQHIPGKMNPVADFLSRSHGPAAIAAISNDTCLHQAQLEDPTLGPILRSLQRGERVAAPQGWARYAPYVRLVHNYLCVRLPARQGFPEDNRLRAIAPKALQSALLREAHNSALGGHQGIFRTLERIRLAFWWPTMDRDVSAHVQACPSCQVASSKRAATAPLHQPLPQTRGPNERIHADLFGPIVDADNNQKFILGMSDSFTKVVRLVAIPNKEAKTVAWSFWKDWMTIYGIPKLIVTDQGLEFTAALQQAIFATLQVKHGTTSPYWPKCNMQQERQNKELAKYLRSILHAANKSSMDWEL